MELLDKQEYDVLLRTNQVTEELHGQFMATRAFYQMRIEDFKNVSDAEIDRCLANATSSTNLIKYAKKHRNDIARWQESEPLKPAPELSI